MCIRDSLYTIPCVCNIRRYTKIAQRIFKHSDVQYTRLTPDKILNSLVCKMLFYVNIYGSFKLSNNSPVFWPTLYVSMYVCLNRCQMEVVYSSRNEMPMGDACASLDPPLQHLNLALSRASVLLQIIIAMKISGTWRFPHCAF